MVCQRELLASWLGLMLRVWWWLYPPSSCVGGWSGLVTFGPSSIGVKVLYWLNATCDACSSVQSKSKRRLLLWLETGHLAPRQRFLQNADRAYIDQLGRSSCFLEHRWRWYRRQSCSTKSFVQLEPIGWYRLGSLPRWNDRRVSYWLKAIRNRHYLEFQL